MLTKLKEIKKEERQSKRLTVICPVCKKQCCSIVIKKKSDGKYWTEDVCCYCGASLPIVRIDSRRGWKKK